MSSGVRVLERSVANHNSERTGLDLRPHSRYEAAPKYPRGAAEIKANGGVRDKEMSDAE